MTATVVPFHSSPGPTFVPERVSAPEPETRVVDVVDTVDTTGNFETLRDRARDLVATGSYQEAAVVYRRAVEVATATGETDLADEALCGWGAAETELGNGTEVMPELRRILLGSQVDHNCYLAAYTLARAHELDGEVRKALFYARLSFHHAASVPRPGLKAGSHNVLGNLLVAEGRENEAATEYRNALREASRAPSTWVAGVEGNLGYCLVASAKAAPRFRRARLREGLKLLYRSLRAFRQAKAELDVAFSHLDLCFAHLELGRTLTAKRHGERALLFGRCHEDSDIIKKSLYLLGQAAVADGDSEAARTNFDELERRFYPGQVGLAGVLMSLDLRQVVNLRA